MLAADIRALVENAALKGCATPPEIVNVAQGFSPADRQAQAAFRALIDRLRGYFLTREGKPRGEKFLGTVFNAEDCDSPDAWKRHRAAAAQIAPAMHEAVRAFRRDLNAVMSRGVWRIFAIALQQYQHTLESHALLDFSGVLERAVQLLKEMDEFAESRLRLEARHRHVLVDEFQDTSRAQWELVRQLVKSWGEGFGAAADAIPPSIFIVGDRKQSIYGFRDADVGDCRRGGRLHRRAQAGWLAAAGDHRQLPVGAGNPRVRQRGVRRDGRWRCDECSGAAGWIPIRRQRSFSGPADFEKVRLKPDPTSRDSAKVGQGSLEWGRRTRD